MCTRSPIARRVLLSVAKILQGVASGVPFGSKEPYMAPANAFLETNRADLVRAVSILWCARARARPCAYVHTAPSQLRTGPASTV